MGVSNFVSLYFDYYLKMKTAILSLLTVVLSVTAASAQQNVGSAAKENRVVSPKVNADHSVTFSLYAPQASEVKVIGDWCAERQGKSMAHGSDGVWSLKSEALPSEMYTYRYVVDGMTIIDPANPFSRRDVGSLFSIFFVGDGPGDYYQVRDVPHGVVTEDWYYSNTLGMNRRMHIYTPPAYNKSNRNYPVLYLLHGGGGDENSWVELGNVARILDNLIAEGKAEEMIVVMPNGNPGMSAAPGETSANHAYRPVNSNFLPGFRNGAYEAAFPEIVNYVDATYKTIPDKSHRAIAGLSMGGFHTQTISANYPDLFDYVGLFSDSFPSHDTSIAAYSNLDEKVKTQIEKGCKLYWVGCGSDDALKIHDKARDYAATLESYGAPVEFHSSPKGHVWSNWRQYLLQFTPRLFKS